MRLHVYFVDRGEGMEEGRWAKTKVCAFDSG